MGQIEDLRLFVTVVNKGGIAKAADELNIAKSAVSRRLGQMEERYGIRLIDRQPRVWEITPAGRELYQRGMRMVSEADELDADFIQSTQSLKGPLKVSIAREFGLSFLRPTIFSFMDNHPEIDLTVDFDDRYVDLENENYDLAVRIMAGEPNGMIHQQIGTTRHGLFASPTYLEKRGEPIDLSELKTHALLHYGSARRAKWEFSCDSKRRAIEFQPALNSNNGPFLIDAALRDLGIIRLPDFVVSDFVTAGQLVPVLPNCEMAELVIYVIHTTNRRLNRRMRAFMETMENGCASLSKTNND